MNHLDSSQPGRDIGRPNGSRMSTTGGTFGYGERIIDDSCLFHPLFHSLTLPIFFGRENAFKVETTGYEDLRSNGSCSQDKSNEFIF